MEKFFKQRGPIAALMTIEDIVGSNGYAVTIIFDKDIGQPTWIEFEASFGCEDEIVTSSVVDGVTISSMYTDKRGLKIILHSALMYTMTGSGANHGFQDCFEFVGKRAQVYFSAPVDKLSKIVEDRKPLPGITSMFSGVSYSVFPDVIKYIPNPRTHPNMSEVVVHSSPEPENHQKADPSQRKPPTKYEVDWARIERLADDAD